MKKPQLCLALSVSIALLQANLLQANAAPASAAIWQKLAGASSQAQGKAVQKPAVRKTAPRVVRTNTVAKKTSVTPVASAHGVASSGMNGQVILFLGKGKKPVLKV